jgi:hypothetical protein
MQNEANINPKEIFTSMRKNSKLKGRKKRFEKQIIKHRN